MECNFLESIKICDHSVKLIKIYSKIVTYFIMIKNISYMLKFHTYNNNITD